MNENSIEIQRVIEKAIEDGDEREVSRLLAEDPTRLNIMTVFGSWLHIAAANGQLGIVKLLLDLGIDIGRCGGIMEGDALNDAAAEGHLKVVQYLLARGAGLDVSESTRNPLFSAIYGGHEDIVRLLLESGIDAGVRYTGQRMKNMGAVEFALERGQQKIARLIQTRLEHAEKG